MLVLTIIVPLSTDVRFRDNINLLSKVSRVVR